MTNLEQIYPSLTLFSDLNWEEVTKEYETVAIEISFPEYLQLKAEEGDCPPYLFELAFYELAAFNAQTSDEPYPHQTGVFLNPTAHFLALQFDVPLMLERASQGKVEILEKDHVLCLYRDKNDEVNSMELYEVELLILQQLENGPRKDSSFVDVKFQNSYKTLVEQGLVMDLTHTRQP